jgi:hypothetical protein
VLNYLLYGHDNNRMESSSSLEEQTKATLKSPNPMTSDEKNAFQGLMKERENFIQETCKQFPSGRYFIMTGPLLLKISKRNTVRTFNFLK